VIYVGAYVICLDAEGRVLLARIAEPELDSGHWTLPGGGLLLGETPEDGAIREFVEETGLAVHLEGPCTPYSQFFPVSIGFAGRPLHFLGFVFRGRVVGGELRAEVDGSTDGAAWFSRTEMLDLPLVELSRQAMAMAWPDEQG
jgi:8-oxo-dGTP diphosphatase